MSVGSVSAQFVPASAVEAVDQQAAFRAPSASADVAFSKQLAAAQRPAVRAPGLQIQAQKTPISGSQAAQAIEKAYRELTGQTPSQGTLAILTSQWSLETAQGQKMYNFNFAGLKGTSPEGYTALLNTREGWGEGERKIRDGFRAYTTIESGAKDYVSLLLRKYGPAIEAAQAEDPTGFAAKLKAGGYYTGDPQSYASAVTRLANKAMGLGFDAVGADGAPPSMSTTELTPYFVTQPAAVTAGDEMWTRGLASAVNSGDGLPQGAVGTQTANAFSDEISRAALRIAARYGA